jgi:hypothetical protein
MLPHMRKDEQYCLVPLARSFVHHFVEHAHNFLFSFRLRQIIPKGYYEIPNPYFSIKLVEELCWKFNLLAFGKIIYLVSGP